MFGGFLYVLGGCTSGDSVVDTVQRYDPRFNSWYQVATMLVPRFCFFAGVVGNRLYAVGGYCELGGEGELDSVEVYDPETNCWKFVTPLPAARSSHVGSVHDGRIYISGGSHEDELQDLLRFDSSKWEYRAPMLMPRQQHVMASVGDRLIVAGGCDDFGDYRCVFEVESYDPVANQWTVIASLPIAHVESSCVVIGGHVYVPGGVHFDGYGYHSKISRYDSEAGTWELMGELPDFHPCASFCVLPMPSYQLA